MKILVLTPDLPSLNGSAGSRRLANLLKALSSKHLVTCALVGKAVDSHSGHQCTIGVELVFLPSISSFIRYSTTTSFDIILFEYWRIGQDYAWISRITNPSALLVVDCVDLEYIRLSRSSTYSKDHVEQTRRDETRLIQYCDAVICVSSNEASIVKNEMGKASDMVTVFSVIYDTVFLKRTPKPGTLLFVGNGGHAPNMDAMTWFCNDVMPKVRSPAVLRIIGSNWPDTLNASNVKVVGFVDNLEEEYSRCLCVVTPIRFGSGVNGKVAEAYCYGLPMIMSSLAADGCGISVGEGLSVLPSNSVVEWVEAIERVVQCTSEINVAVTADVSNQFSYSVNEMIIVESFDRFENVRTRLMRQWELTVFYGFKFVISHICHLIGGK